MNKTLITSLLAVSSALASAQNADSIRIEELHEVSVSAVKAYKDAPFAITNVSRAELSEFSKTGQELPMLLMQTPSVVASFDNGLGIGTGYLRIRGSVDSRINITLDGVPLNSPEDQCVFWANMNSYAGSLGSIQVQRGVGTSTNGDGAFGASVVMTSKAPSLVPTAEVSGSYGSYNTYVLGGSFSTGLLWHHLIFDGRYTETNSDGYIHETGSRSGSYYAGLTWLDESFVIRYRNFGNFETTDQAWNGLSKADWDAGRYKYNSLNEWYDEATDTYHRYPFNTYDHFWQNRNILTGTFYLSDLWKLNTTFHYTHGYGYYNNYKPDCEISKFGLDKDDFDGVKKDNLIRKKGLDQDFFGVMANVNYTGNRLEAVAGYAVQQFESNHFGRLVYAEAIAAKLLKDGDYTYYDSDAGKLDANVFAKATWHISNQWSAFGDLQYRHVNYNTDGINDKFYDSTTGLNNQILDVHKRYHFFNPKAGITWKKGGQTAYASFAMSHREPTRNNFTDNGSYPAPKAEKLLDWEAGYEYRNETFAVGANLYFMDYDNQFVLTGEVSDIGEALTTNVKDSYRLGIELTGSWNAASWMQLAGNLALSQNKIKDFDEVIEKYDADWGWIGYTTVHHDNGDLAMSPSVTANLMANFNWRDFTFQWHTNWVGDQYLDNTGSKDRMLDGYSTTNLRFGYTLNIGRAVKSITFGANVNNLFNKRYAPNGGVYSALVGTDDPEKRYNSPWYFPMSGTTALGNITVRF